MSGPRPHIRARFLIALSVAATLPAGAQTEYRDAEAASPIRIEDATTTERSALDLSLASLRFERLRTGTFRWQAEPRMSFGVAPRAEAWVRLPVAYRQDGPAPRGGVAGMGFGGMYSLNIETMALPAVAISGEAFLPVGGASTGRPAYSVKTMLTRSTRRGRMHLNGSYGTYGLRETILLPPDPFCIANPQAPQCQVNTPVPPIDGPCARRAPASRTGATPLCSVARAAVSGTTTLGGDARYVHWLAGAAVDHALPLRSVLLLADVFAEQFGGIGRPTDWVAEVGTRVQLSPRFVLATGVGQHFRGFNQSWFVTAGTTVTLAGPLLERRR